MNEDKEWLYCNDEELKACVYVISLYNATLSLFLVFHYLTNLFHTVCLLASLPLSLSKWPFSFLFNFPLLLSYLPFLSGNFIIYSSP